MAEVEGAARPQETPCDAGETGEGLFARALPVSRQEAILNALAEKVSSGDVHVAAFLFDRLYGRPSFAPRRTLAVKPEQEYDLRLLDDEELATLDRLLTKCTPGATAASGWNDGKEAL